MKTGIHVFKNRAAIRKISSFFRRARALCQMTPALPAAPRPGSAVYNPDQLISQVIDFNMFLLFVDRFNMAVLDFVGVGNKDR